MVGKGRVGRVHTLYYLGLRLAQDLARTLYKRYQVDTYI